MIFALLRALLRAVWMTHTSATSASQRIRLHSVLVKKHRLEKSVWKDSFIRRKGIVS